MTIHSKDQLSYRLNKNWRIHKKTTKGKAEALWRYIEFQTAERQRIGKASNQVILDGALVEVATMKKEIGRYSQGAWSSGINGMLEENRLHNELFADAWAKLLGPRRLPDI